MDIACLRTQGGEEDNHNSHIIIIIVEVIGILFQDQFLKETEISIDFGLIA